MGKLVVKFQGKLIAEVTLRLGDMKIGRKPGCEIVLNDPGVSGEHAVVKTVGLKSTIQDLGSTNGTFIENERVTSRALRHGETITIGQHTLIYRDDVTLSTATASNAGGAGARESLEKTTVLMAFAQLLAIDGPHKGKRLPLVKETVVIDNPGKSPARILRTSEGYVLHAQVGPGEPRINDRPVPPGGQLLENGDVIEVAGTKYQMYR
ncbi:MAG: FHA domain-containing protein [Gammaproteobacteria bacterium]